MKHLLLLLLALAGGPFILPLDAQMPGGAPGLNTGLLKLFGKTEAFSAHADIRLLDRQGQKESLNLSMEMAVLGGSIRADMDMNHVHGKDIDPAQIARMKQLGMDRFYTILRTDRAITYYVYPSLTAYVETTTAKEADPKLAVTRLGKETIDGQGCVKNKIVITAASGERMEAIVWNATKLNDFPVKMQLYQPEAVVVMQYRNIKFTPPEAKVFDPPAQFARHDSMEKLIMSRVLGLGK